MFDTYGFPYELTFESAQDAGLKVDKKGFDAEMAANRRLLVKRYRYLVYLSNSQRS